jgi:hypothetical protein
MRADKEDEQKKQIEQRKDNIWVDEDGIINIIIAMENPAEETEGLLEKVRTTIRASSGKARILVDISGPILGHMRSSQARKGVTEEIKEWLNRAKFEKAAVFGGDTIRRTITSFVITATGMKNVRIFGTREDALRWLKNS